MRSRDASLSIRSWVGGYPRTEKYPALSNNIQDQRDFFTRVQKQEESVAKLKEKLATGYAIISRLVTGPETRALIKQAETGVPLGQEYRLRHLCRNIIALMDMKYASNDIIE